MLLYCTVHVCHSTGGTALSVSRLSGGTIMSLFMGLLLIWASSSVCVASYESGSDSEVDTKKRSLSSSAMAGLTNYGSSSEDDEEVIADSAQQRPNVSHTERDEKLSYHNDSSENVKSPRKLQSPQKTDRSPEKEKHQHTSSAMKSKSKSPPPKKRRSRSRSRSPTRRKKKRSQSRSRQRSRSRTPKRRHSRAHSPSRHRHKHRSRSRSRSRSRGRKKSTRS